MSTKNSIRIFMTILSISLGFNGILAGAEWYEEAKAVQDDAYGFASSFTGATGSLFSKGFRMGGSFPGGKYYAILKRAEYDGIVGAGELGQEWSTHVITSQDAEVYRSFFSEKGDGIKLPVWFNLGSGVLGLSKRLNFVGTVATLLSVGTELINAGAKGYLETAKNIAVRINPGDKFVRRVFIEIRNGRPYAHMLDTLVFKGSEASNEVLLQRMTLAVRIE